MHFYSSTLDNMTDNNTFNAPLGANDPNFMITSMLSNMTSNCPTQPYSLDLNTQRQFMVEFPALSLLQGELMNTPNMSNPVNDSCLLGNTEFNDRFFNENATLVSASSLATLLASRFGSRGNINEVEHSPLVNPLDNNHHEVLNSSFANSLNDGYDTVYGQMNNKWAFDKYLACSESIDQNQWISSNSSIMNSNNPCGSSNCDKELSLSLATCHTPIGRGTVIPDQCSEISSSVVTPFNERQFGSKTSVGSHRQVQIAQFSSGSRYLCVIQEILAQIASFSLEHFDQVNYPGTLTRNSLSRSSLTERDYSMMDSDVDGAFCAARGREIEAKKQQLVSLLEVVDEQHNQCLDEIHTVISAFHAATELDPRVHARFALQTVSALYKNLRERISNQILAMGAAPSRNGENREDEVSFETNFIQKQWALQQLRKKDHQLWRPQRGLPERSVSVLRAWMFQNFLHPYPKDAEKHLLAVKSGLTRSQVSNWFINARVRLWKPMIEEMYAEVNRRKGRRNDEDTNNGHKNTATFGNLRFDM